MIGIVERPAPRFPILQTGMFNSSFNGFCSGIGQYGTIRSKLLPQLIVQGFQPWANRTLSKNRRLCLKILHRYSYQLFVEVPQEVRSISANQIQDRSL